MNNIRNFADYWKFLVNNSSIQRDRDWDVKSQATHKIPSVLQCRALGLTPAWAYLLSGQLCPGWTCSFIPCSPSLCHIQAYALKVSATKRTTVWCPDREIAPSTRLCIYKLNLSWEVRGVKSLGEENTDWKGSLLSLAGGFPALLSKAEF